MGPEAKPEVAGRRRDARERMRAALTLVEELAAPTEVAEPPGFFPAHTFISV